MNEKLQYASMLEIPLNTCTIVRKPQKNIKKRGKKQRNLDEVKNQLVQMVNQNVENQTQVNVQNDNTNAVNQVSLNEQIEYVQAITENCQTNMAEQTQVNGERQYSDAVQENVLTVTQNDETTQTETQNAVESQQPCDDISSSVTKIKRAKKPFKLSIISVQLTIIGVLLATIFLTNAFYSGSGLNALVDSVFGNSSTSVDNRVYSDFSPVINCGGNSEYVFDNGIFNFSGEGSVYSPCDGKVLQVSLLENGKYTIKIAHNNNFISVFSGLDYAYCTPNDRVFGNIPVGYIAQGSAEMCFTDNMGEIISDYQVVDNAVIWPA